MWWDACLEVVSFGEVGDATRDNMMFHKSPTFEVMDLNKMQIGHILTLFLG